MTNKIEINIENWVGELMKEKKIDNYVVEMSETTEKGQNYIGDIKFVTVKIKDTAKNEPQDLNLVIKHGKADENSRKTFPIRLFFEREIDVYTKVMPFFRNFEKEKNVQQPFTSVPKCYKSLVSNSAEFLILDNLKIKGYRVQDRQKPLSISHLKLVLEQYGKWHALSFAARDQKNTEITQITDGWQNIFDIFLALPEMDTTFQKLFEAACRILEENKEIEILDKFKKDFNGMHGVLLDIFRNKEPNWVVTHGDCWLNNFMFKYKYSEEIHPIEVAIIDWQASILASPVIDLMYFIYCASSGEQLKHLGDLLKVYHNSLSNHIRALGCEPEKLFPIDEFKRHWNRYKKFPIAFLPLTLQAMLSSKEDSFNIEDISKNSSFAGSLSSLKTDITYDTRMLEMLKHHYTFKFE